MTAGYKFKGGKFVKRTEDEEQRLKEYFAETDKPGKAKKQRPDLFIKLTMTQLDKLIPELSKVPLLGLFFVLCYEDFRHRGAAFVLPAEQLERIGGIKPRTQRHVVARLEALGLICVKRRTRKPPIVRLL